MRKSLLIWFLILALVPASLITWLGYNYSRQSLYKLSHYYLHKVADENIEFINNWFNYRVMDISYFIRDKETLTLFSKLTEARQINQQPLVDFTKSDSWHQLNENYNYNINNIIESYDYIDNVMFIERGGDVLYSIKPSAYLGHNMMLDFNESLLTKIVDKSVVDSSVLFSDFWRDKDSKKIVSFMSAPVMLNKDIIGVMVLELNYEKILSVINNKVINEKDNIYHYIVGGDELLRTPIVNFPINEVLVKNIPYLDESEEILHYESLSGEFVLAIHHEINVLGIDWNIISEINDDSVLESINELRYIVVKFLFLVSIFTTILALWKANKMTKPLTMLTDIACKISTGDNSARITMKSDNEVGILVSAFNHLLSVREQQWKSLKDSHRLAKHALDDLKIQETALNQHVIVSMTDLKGTITFVNDKFCELSQYSEKELLGNNHNILNSDYKGEDFYRELFETINNGKVWKGEIRNKNKRGEFYWLESSIMAFQKKGETYYIAMSTDISNIKQYEFSLKENQQRLEMVLESTGGGIWDWDVLNDIIVVNQRLANILGYSLQAMQLFSMTQWLDYVHDDDVNYFKCCIDSEPEDNWSYEIRMRHKYGHWIWVIYSGETMEYNNAGQSLRIIGSLIDISERKYTEIKQQQILEATEIKLAIAHALTDSLSLRKRLDNAVNKLLNLSNLTKYKKGCVFLYDQEKKQFKLYSNREDINIDMALTHCEMGLKSADIKIIENCQGDDEGEGHQGHGHYIVPLRGMHAYDGEQSDDKTVGILLLYTDNIIIDIDIEKLSFLKEIANIFATSIMQADIVKLTKKAKLEAEASNKLKGEFLATMSHEIRTPMNGVIGMTDLLLNDHLNSDQRERAELIKNSAQSLLTIINDILDFSKIEAGKLSLDLHDFNLTQLVAEVMNNQKNHADSKQLSLINLNEKDAVHWYKSDSTRIRQILNNLINNAIKFTLEGEVTVSYDVIGVHETMDIMRFVIQDSGIGLSEPQQQKLFKKFSQSDSSTTRKFGGTGLGLAISKELVLLMGGEIGMESELGIGSNFWFSLYLERIERPNKENLSLLNVITPSIKKIEKTILVVDDNKTNQIVATGMLKLLGYQFDVAANGQEALDLLAESTYALILMDCQMPIMDGYVATDKIRQGDQQSDIVIVAMTANVMKGDKEKCLAAGMNDFLAKPMEINKLQAIIDKWLVDSQDTVLEVNKAEKTIAIEDKQDTLIFDEAALNERMMADKELINMVIDTFLDELPNQIEELCVLIEHNDYDNICKQAHKIKGSAANVGVMRLSELAFQIETAAKLENVADDMRLKLEKFKQHSDELVKILRAYQQ